MSESLICPFCECVEDPSECVLCEYGCETIWCQGCTNEYYIYNEIFYEKGHNPDCDHTDDEED